MPHFMVCHDIKQPDVWKATTTDNEKMGVLLKAMAESKFDVEVAYATDSPNKQFCLWHSPDVETAKGFTEWFYKTWLPQSVADSSKYWIASDQGFGVPTPPGQQFEQKGKGTFVLVHHKVKDYAKAKAGLDEWGKKGLDACFSHNLEHGFHNHTFLPTTGDNGLEKDYFSAWELKDGKTKVDLKTYCDTFVLKPDCCENVVYLLNETSGQNSNLPTSKFK